MPIDSAPGLVEVGALMALEQKLSLRLSQRLVMTPTLQQSIKMLQLTKLELEGYLAQELVENPVLEDLREGDDEPVDPDERAAIDTAAGTAPEQEAADRSEEGSPENREAEPEPEPRDPLDEIDLDAYYGEVFESSGTAGMSSTFEEREGPPLENTLSRDPDLWDHLLWQLHMAEVPARLREIGEIIIGNLDEDGFLVAELDEIAAMGRERAEGQPYALEEVEAALALVQALDPPGIACRDLRESLLRQLELRGDGEESLVRQVIEHHWEAFLHRQFAKIAAELGIALADLEPVVEAIKTLEIRPGRAFGGDRPHYVEPDVAVIKVGDEYVIQLNDDGMPKLRVSRAYREMLQAAKGDASDNEAQQYLREKMRSALWLIKSLDQRQRTIYKVADSIVRQQRDFLDHGVDRLRPMVLRDVAEDIGMHESTVSRVVSNKYIHTPRGLLPLKFFFHSGIDRAYGEDISSLSVKRKIEQLVQGEDPRRPLSDSAIMKVLQREGINIARRTVAKYRDELGIASSSDRRQIF